MLKCTGFKVCVAHRSAADLLEYYCSSMLLELQYVGRIKPPNFKTYSIKVQ